MATRGPYAKGRAKRAEILDAALDVIAREGYSKATVRTLADEVGLSQNGLLHYFGSKDALFAEIVRYQDERSDDQFNPEGRRFADDLVESLLGAVEEVRRAPGISLLTLRMAGEATEPEHPHHAYFRERYAAVRALVEEAIRDLEADGRVGPGVDPAAVAALVFAAWDGLQLQAMYDDSVDVRATMAYLLEGLGLPVHPSDVAARAW